MADQTKLVALYQHPPDPEAFDQAYFDTHMPLLAKVPGLERTVLTRFGRAIMGQSVYMMAEMHFADEASMKQALKSPEMAAAGENLAGFAGGLVTLMMASEPSGL
ncbi:MAG TPA: EthD family reductase [Anaerolineales bacterium]|jgi:uncharacterized protein (TIGR02118 family)